MYIYTRLHEAWLFKYIHWFIYYLSVYLFIHLFNIQYIFYSCFEKILFIKNVFGEG